jgi:hypothetical protein
MSVRPIVREYMQPDCELQPGCFVLEMNIGDRSPISVSCTSGPS